MKALVYTHHPQEGLGLIEQILIARGWEVRQVRLWEEQSPDLAPFHLLIIMGGPMSVNEKDLYPFLHQEEEQIRRWVLEERPIIGVCLGAQLIAHALGGKVYRGIHQEIGWYNVSLTAEGRKDPYLWGYPQTFSVFQWHGETFELPLGAVHLVTSDDYPNQAFRFGNFAYAFQFHLEVTEQMVRSWLDTDEVDEAKKHKIISQIPRHIVSIERLLRGFMYPFLDAIEGLSKARS